ncbi:MAG: myo-inosose-2 dehydratase [Christensenellales bacterium]|jgi:inosose dehydratase
MTKIRLGIAPIGWTNDDMPDLGAEISFERCIGEMASAGYEGTEIGNKYPKDPALLKTELAKKGLVIANCWHSTFILTRPFSEVEEDFRQTCQKLKVLGARVVGVSEQSYSIQGTDKGVFEEKYVMNAAEWDKLAQGLNALGGIAKEYGISLTFHHHMGTVVQSEEEIDTLMAATDKERVSLLYDSGHAAYAGADYVRVINKHIDRIKHIHLKDIRKEVIDEVKAKKLSFLQGVRMGTFTVPGDGALDFAPIFALVKQSGYSGWLLVEAEQDPAIAPPLEYAKKAKAYMDNLIKRYDL